MAGPHWHLSEDNTHLIVDFPTEPPARFRFDAEETDAFIANLAEMRMAMTPPIPLDEAPDPGTRLVAALNGRWQAEPARSGNGVVLALAHPGYRWVALVLEWPAVSELLKTLHRLHPDPPQL